MFTTFGQDVFPPGSGSNFNEDVELMGGPRTRRKMRMYRKQYRKYKKLYNECKDAKNKYRKKFYKYRDLYMKYKKMYAECKVVRNKYKGMLENYQQRSVQPVEEGVQGQGNKMLLPLLALGGGLIAFNMMKKKRKR